MRLPLVVIVSGAPGAGKTTLAHKLAYYMRLPHIPRDEIMRGIEMTEGGPINKGVLGINTYYQLVGQILEANISLVTDGTIYQGLSERDIKERVLPRAEAVNVHVRATNEHQRFIDREKQREGWSSEWTEGHLKRLDEIYTQAVEPLELGIPLIEVDATDGYDPPISHIAARIREIYQDTRPGILHTGKAS